MNVVIFVYGIHNYEGQPSVWRSKAVITNLKINMLC